jgi:rubredoxin
MMPISMDRFGSHEQRAKSHASGGLRHLVFPYRLQCRACGFEPFDVISPPPHCPKCAGHSWERFAFPGSLLAPLGGCANVGTLLRSSFTSVDAI